MKTKLFTLFLALVASIGSIYANWLESVIIGDFRYILDEETKTAKIIYRYREYILGVTYYNLISGNKYWDIETANIPATIVYNEETYDVTCIGEYAFNHCDSLRAITIPSSVTTIEAHAFDYCNNLVAINVTDIAAWCTNDFKDKNPLALAHYLYFNDELITDLVIPDGVTNIAEKAFYGCKNITSVTIPSSVTSIEKDAFVRCTALKSAIIGDCDISTSVTPNNFMSIKKSAFLGTLSSVTIGKNVANIEEDAFAQIKSVTLYSDTLVSRTYSLGKNMETIFGDGVQEYIIGEGVKSIGKYAFKGCIQMTSITLPKSLIKIDADAFMSCFGLDAVHIADLALWCSVTFTSGNYDRTSNPLLYAHNLYLNGELVTDLIIPDNITRIGEWAFCRGSFKSVTIPNNNINIGKNAFYECTNLNAVHITDIASWCNIDFQNGYSQPLCYAHNLYLNGELVTDLVIPSSVTSIGDYSFYECSNLTSVNIPSSVTRIGNGAFYACKKIPSINIPNCVTYIGESAFAKCENLMSVELPDSLTNISEHCFLFCSHLASVTLPNRITGIGNGAFAMCESLTSIDIPSSVTAIGESAFSGSTSLTSVNIQNGVTYIGSDAFYLTSLSSITLPSSLAEVGVHVFALCEQLEEIILLTETPPVFVGQNPTVNKFAGNVPIYVPCGTLEAYMASDWSAYNIQYHPNIFNLNVSSADTLKGQVNVNGNICENVLSAIPRDGNYFVQWSDGSTDNPRAITLTQDTTISAIFATQTFTVTFVDDNDTILSSQEYDYGSMPEPPVDPVKTNDAQYTYTFAGWSPQLVMVTNDTTYKATYNSTLNKYTITFMSEDSVLSADLWEYGAMPIYRGKTPTKDEDEEYTYTFEGWTPEIVFVVADATYMATYIATEKTEAIDNILDKSILPAKIVDNGNIYILMPNGKKYSIIGELVK